MHKIHEKEFTLEDFSIENLDHYYIKQFEYIINSLNQMRNDYIRSMEKNRTLTKRKKMHWYSMIQLLPSSYNQTRNVMMNYEVLCNVYKSRKSHRLDEWVEFCAWIKTLPYQELITGEGNERKVERN